MSGPGVSLEPVALEREVVERLLHGRVLTPGERLERAREALDAAVWREACGVGPSPRVDWQQAEVERLERELVLGQRVPAVRTARAD